METPVMKKYRFMNALVEGSQQVSVPLNTIIRVKTTAKFV